MKNDSQVDLATVLAATDLLFIVVKNGSLQWHLIRANVIYFLAEKLSLFDDNGKQNDQFFVLADTFPCLGRVTFLIVMSVLKLLKL